MIPRHELESPDLDTLLRSLSGEDIDRLARLIANMSKQDLLNRFHLASSIDKRQLRGAMLVPDILADLSQLASHTTGPTPNYREILRMVAGRHGIKDDGKRPPAEVERELQSKNADQLRPKATTFKDKGSSGALRKLAFFVPVGGWAAWLMSPNWDVVTAAVLEISALRRIALMEQFAQSLEETP